MSDPSFDLRYGVVPHPSNLSQPPAPSSAMPVCSQYGSPAPGMQPASYYPPGWYPSAHPTAAASVPQALGPWQASQPSQASLFMPPAPYRPYVNASTDYDCPPSASIYDVLSPYPPLPPASVSGSLPSGQTPFGDSRYGATSIPSPQQMTGRPPPGTVHSIPGFSGAPTLASCAPVSHTAQPPQPTWAVPAQIVYCPVFVGSPLPSNAEPVPPDQSVGQRSSHVLTLEDLNKPSRSAASTSAFSGRGITLEQWQRLHPQDSVEGNVELDTSSLLKELHRTKTPSRGAGARSSSASSGL